MKKVIEACIDRVLEFDSENEAMLYLEKLEDGHKNFRLILKENFNDKYRIRVQEAYNNSPLIGQMESE